MSAALDLLQEACRSLPCQIKRMFGGHGAFAPNGGMFAGIVTDDEVILKLADEEARSELIALGGKPWTYHGQKKPMVMREWIVIPAEFYDDQDLFAAWARRAHRLAPAKAKAGKSNIRQARAEKSDTAAIAPRQATRKGAGRRAHPSANPDSPVDAYMARLPEAPARVLSSVRATLRKALPQAEEVISYGIPALKQDGRVVIFFAGWKEHVSVYPTTEGVMRAHGVAIGERRVSKGTIRFSLEEKLPTKLLAEIAKTRLQEEAIRSAEKLQKKAAQQKAAPKRAPKKKATNKKATSQAGAGPQMQTSAKANAKKKSGYGERAVPKTRGVR